jgi:hypothetical protein
MVTLQSYRRHHFPANSGRPTYRRFALNRLRSLAKDRPISPVAWQQVKSLPGS